MKKSFATDTATLCVFDPTRLKHRLIDDVDWWCMPEPELLEVNAGNVIFIGLESDGVYNLVLDGDVGTHTVEANLQCPSGQMFIGAGEEVTGDGLEPDGTRGGGFIELNPGNYRISASKDGNSIRLSFSSSDSATNSFTEPLRL